MQCVISYASAEFQRSFCEYIAAKLKSGSGDLLPASSINISKPKQRCSEH